MQRSVQSTLQILDLIAHSPDGLTMREISPLCSGVSTATIYRILKTLSAQGFVVQDRDSKRYRVSLRLWELGAAALNQIHYRDVAAPHAIDLVTQVGYTVTLSFAEGEEMVFSEMFELHDERVISKPAVLRIPFAATASGKVFVAHLGKTDDEVRALVRRTPRFTERTIADPEELVRQVHEARRHGWAESLGEFWPDSGAISAAACDFAGRPRVAINVGFRLIEHGTPDALDELRSDVLGPLLACTERVSMQLGRRALPLPS